MKTTSLASRSDDELLGFTKTVLSEQGFQIETMGENIELIVAENSYFVVAVAAVNTIHNLILAEPIVFEALSQRLDSVVLGPKKWDTYIVLLTQEKSAEDDSVTRDLYAINHDTSRVRRIAHTGVDPTPEAVRHALALFIEPVTPATNVAHTDALESLLHILISDGVGEELAQRAVTAFEQGASLDDVLKSTIDRLRVEAFRGFRDAREFDLSASAVVVTGPNGTGKTSFFDALQWVLLGKIERLEALRSRRNVEHIVNQYRIGRKASVEIDLSLPAGQAMLRRTGDQGGSTLELSRRGEAPLFGEEAEAELRRILLPQSELSLHSALTTSGLMQQDVLRSVLEAKPTERYRQLSTVLGLGALEDFEDATKSVAKQASEREGQVRSEHSKLFLALKQAQDRLETAQARLSSRPQIEAVRNEVLDRLRATPAGVSFSDAGLNLEQPDDVRLAATGFGRAVDLVESTLALVRRASQLREGLGDPPNTDTIDALRAEVDRAEATRDAAEALRGAAQSQLNTARLTAADVAKLAALAVPMLSDDCPVCGQRIDREHVERELIQRAEATGTLLELENAFVERANDFSEASTAASEASDALAAAQEQAERWHASSDADRAAAVAVEALAADIPLVRFDQCTTETFGSVAVPASEYFRGARRVLHDLLETFDRQSDQSAIERAAAECTSLEAALAAAEGQLATETARSKKLQALAEKTLGARVEVTERRLRSIQPLVADIFHRLDPHPSFKTIEFELDTYYRKGTTSPLVIDQVTNISADPLLIFSTSQANIVALSYFIAMSLSMEDAGLPFLLLDDPVQSMDDVNVLGFADLCRHLRVRRQLIVSTHERRLSGLLERKLAPRAEGSRTKIIRFTGWDRSGPTVDERDVDGQMLEDPIRVLGRAG